MSAWLLIALVLCTAAVPAPAQEDSSLLPTYYLRVDSAHLRTLEERLTEDVYVPATVVIGEREHECEVRYRGGSSRTAPKRSWRIKFEDDDGPPGVNRINLTAQYYDRSLLRNYLSMKLYDFFDLPAPLTYHANVYLNGGYAGVYLVVEGIDADFFAARGISAGALYKALNHGAHCAPLLDSRAYSNVWECKIGSNTYNPLQSLLSSLTFLPQDRFADYVEHRLDVRHVLMYFAVEYVLAAHDNATKNFFLYYDTERERFSVVPWDNDAVMGNDWKGDFSSTSYTLRPMQSLFRSQLLMQRMLQIPALHAQFEGYVQDIIGEGFDYVEMQIDSAAQRIRTDVYRDTAKCCSNDEFESALDDIRAFLTGRRAFLQTYHEEPHTPPVDLSCSHAFARPGDTVTFRARSTPQQSVGVRLAYDADLGVPGDSVGIVGTALYDDGLHNDGAAGDGHYAGSVVIPEQASPVLPYTFTSSRGSYPEQGLLFLTYYPSVTPAVVVTDADEDDYRRLRMADVVRLHDDVAVALVNTSGRALDLSYSSLHSTAPHLRLPFPPGTVLAPDDTVVVTTNAPLATRAMPGSIVIGGLFFPVGQGDTLVLLGPDGRRLAEYAVDTIVERPVEFVPIVVNEICYHPVDTRGGEWVELYNPAADTVDIGNWTVQDSDDSHLCILPAGTVVPPDGYVVVCTDTAAFDSAYPAVRNRMGTMDFGLAGDDEIRLYDIAGRLVDSVAYSDTQPWPEAPDGGGATLELVHHSLDNNDARYWYASIPDGGTPGRVNSVVGMDTTGERRKIVINEINYRSSEPFDSGDWVELYNADTAGVDIGGWMLLDERDDHVFRIPHGTVIGKDGYLVLVRNVEEFRDVYPTVGAAHCTGPLGFGLSGDGGEVRLLNPAGHTVDSVRYSGSFPWPELPDAVTLELLAPDLDNTTAVHWQASFVPGGTPAARNSSRRDTTVTAGSLSPVNNPARDVFSFVLRMSERHYVLADMVDVQGRYIDTVIDGWFDTGEHSISRSARDVRAGVYFVRCRIGGNAPVTVIVVRIP